MATPTASVVKGGYDYEFIDPPPQRLECSICLQTLRDPHVTTCCGNHFCQPCISRIQRDNRSCPLCNEPDFTTFLHKGVAREVKALKVYCPKKPQGCDWQGELGQVEQHLNPGPAESRVKGCGFVMVVCRYECGGQFQRQMMEQHENKDCPRQPGKANERQMAVIMKRLEVLATENKAEMQTLKDENKAHKEKLESLAQEMQQIKEENKALKRQIEAHPLPPVPPFYYTLSNYQHHKMSNNCVISNPFYSHYSGYKMMILIWPNGQDWGTNSHLALFVSIMRGEYDDKLQWPFTGKVTVEAYNFKTNRWARIKTIDFREHPLKKAENNCGTTSGQYGYPRFISNHQLQAEYLGFDLIRFRIAKVEL